MQRITSFSVDHDYIVPGMYISRIDGDITTYDLQFGRGGGCHILRPHGLPHGLLSAHALAEP